VKRHTHQLSLNRSNRINFKKILQSLSDEHIRPSFHAAEDKHLGYLVLLFIRLISFKSLFYVDKLFQAEWARVGETYFIATYLS
jgi:hypothetical protein